MIYGSLSGLQVCRQGDGENSYINYQICLSKEEGSCFDVWVPSHRAQRHRDLADSPGYFACEQVCKTQAVGLVYLLPVFPKIGFEARILFNNKYIEILMIQMAFLLLVSNPMAGTRLLFHPIHS